MSTSYSSVATATTTYSRVQTINYLTDQILLSLKDVIVRSGLDPTNFTGDWELYERGVKTWLTSGHLEAVTLEVFDRSTNALIRRWDISVYHDSSGFSGLSADPENIRYTLAKLGKVPSQCGYKILIDNKPGRPDVQGWSPGSYRSTGSLKSYGVGTTISANGQGTRASYWK